LILIKIGRGVGAGIVLNGSLFYGDGASAGEIGQVVVAEENGRLLTLEDIASTPAILQQAETVAQGPVEWEALLHAKAYDTVFERVGHFIGVAVAHLIGGFNIHHISITGRIAQRGDPFLETIRQTAMRYALPRTAAKTEIAFSTLGNDIVLLGCSALVLKHELGIV
ncbi:MAG: ROK family protein, partial [Chloroflexota bacterium]